MWWRRLLELELAGEEFFLFLVILGEVNIVFVTVKSWLSYQRFMAVWLKEGSSSACAES